MKMKYTEDNYPNYLKRNIVHKYVIRVTLKNYKPAIWRKFEVPSNISLRHLGDLIIRLMGWTNSHMNHFYKGQMYFVPYYRRDEFYDGDFDDYNQEDYTI